MATLLEMHSTWPSKEDPPVSGEQRKEYFEQIPEWKTEVREGVERLERVFKFDNFVEALDFTNKVGAMAEAEDHHPALLTEWGKVTVTWWTHFVGGLHLNDFIAAAKTDQIYSS